MDRPPLSPAETTREESPRDVDVEVADRPRETVLWIDSRGRVIAAREASCRALGYGPDELRGLPWSEVNTRLSTRDWPRIWNRTRRVGQWVWRTDYRRKDGSGFPVEVTASFLELDGRECFLALGRDVTELLHGEEERRRLEAQILHTQKLESLGVVAGGIAHDFNNLLVSILGNTNLALMKIGAESPGRRHLTEVETAARRAADLVGQMLAYTGKADFVVDLLDVNGVIREMTQLLRVSISKQARLDLELAAEPILVEADGTQLRQILMNLILNASEAVGRRNGRVSVSTGVMSADRAYLAEARLGADLKEGRYAYFEVADTGCGIAEEDAAKIFDPFYTTKAEGRGLGLAAVAGILRGHAGALRLESAPGEGTTIRVLLPAGPRRSASAVRPAPENGDWSGRGSVLVVDDEEVIRVVARRTLEQAGFEVLSARDGVEALEIYQRHGEQIVAALLDIVMPRLDGIETLFELRMKRPDLRVLLSSGYSEHEVVPAFTNRRFSGYLKKPYRPVDLVRELSHLLGVPAANGSSRSAAHTGARASSAPG